MYNLSEIVSRISEECTKKGITVNQMLINCHIGTSLIDNMKRGRNPSIDKIYTVAQYLNVSADYLLGMSKNPNGLQEDKNDIATKSIDVFELKKKLRNNMELMNEQGLQRLSDYSDDLIGNPSYVKPVSKKSTNTPNSPKPKTDTPDLSVVSETNAPKEEEMIEVVVAARSENNDFPVQKMKFPKSKIDRLLNTEEDYDENL